MEVFRFFYYAHLENTSGDMRMSSDLYLIYMKSRNFMPIVKYDGAKFQVGRESVYINVSLINCIV